MTTPTKGPIMTDLISRLEALEGPSRGVDAEIAVQTRWMLLGMEKPDIQFAMPTAEDNCEPGTFWQIDFGKSLHTAPEFTASIDAAMSLVPDDLFPMIDCDDDGKGSVCVEMIYHTDTTDNGLGCVSCAVTKGGKRQDRIARAIAIATLEALKARQSNEQS